MKIMRNFSVELSNPQAADGDYTKGKSYPVLVLDKDDDGDVYLLLADDNGRLHWEDWTTVKVTEMEGRDRQ